MERLPPATEPGQLDIDGRPVHLSSLRKVLWPRTGFTKAQMIDYYRCVAPALLPHLARRPLTLGRFPDGVQGSGFAQTECRGRPSWMATHQVRLRSGDLRSYCVLDDLPSLVWVANLGTIELHPFLWRAEDPDRPDVVVFDLDPGAGSGPLECCRVALAVRHALARLGLRSFPKTSGSAGLHVYVPINSAHGHPEARAFARALAGHVAGEHPRDATDKTRRSPQEQRVLVDWGGNSPGRSTVAAYSLRAAPWPTVSTPVTWEEIEEALATRTPELLIFLPDDVLERIDRFGDLFRPVLELTQRLPD